ncbi:hypothetical protein OK016_18120 [Vibrio chagasii]|nr:hypothetical protein [Vibrio chagasii]
MNGDSDSDVDNGFDNIDPGYGKGDSKNIADIIEQADLGFAPSQISVTFRFSIKVTTTQSLAP